jgi:hypothetical protein
MQFALLNLIKQEDYELMVDTLQKQNFTILTMNGQDIYDESSFFTIVEDALPLDPPLNGMVNWDAFADSLWEGVLNLNQKQVAIIWTDVEKVLNEGLKCLLKAMDIFSDTARGLYVEKTHSVVLLIFLLGRGDSFKSLK